MKHINPLKSLLIFGAFFSAITSCKKDTPLNQESGATSGYWISTNTDDRFLITKGKMVSDGTNTVTTLYTRDADRYIWYMSLRAGTKELYWCEVRVDANDDVTSYIYKGDTLGGAPTLVLTRPNLMGNIAVHPVSGDVYWSQYEEADQHEYLYRSKNDGTGTTKLYTGREQVAAADIKIDVANNLLYFIEGYYEGSMYNDFRICKGNLDGSGIPEVLYDLTDIPAATGIDDRLTGLEIHGTDLYISLRAFNAGKMNYIVKGKTDGTVPLTVLVKSVPGVATNPLESPLGITLDKSGEYLYWTNQTPVGNVALGSIYRIGLTGNGVPEKVLSDIRITGGLYGPLALGE